jgi:hypothetical protein
MKGPKSRRIVLDEVLWLQATHTSRLNKGPSDNSTVAHFNLCAVGYFHWDDPFGAFSQKPVFQASASVFYSVTKHCLPVWPSAIGIRASPSHKRQPPTGAA